MAEPDAGFIMGAIVPGLPQPLLAADQNAGWGRLRAAFDRLRDEIAALEPDLLLIYSVMWPSVIGHQIQADPEPRWVHVDELFHDLGSMPYEFRIDAPFAEAFRSAAEARGLTARTVAYHGFPIDTGSVVALKLLNPNNAIPAGIVSSNVYADRSETVVLGKAAADAVRAGGKRAVAVCVTTLSNRLFTSFIDPAEDRIHSRKDDEWNQKMLEFLGAGRLEDVAQLSREIHQQIRVSKVVNFKPMWWLSAAMGQNNNYQGEVLAYEALYGTGGAVVSLRPTAGGIGDKEFDEEDVESYRGDRDVLSDVAPSAAARSTPAAAPTAAAAPSPAVAQKPAAAPSPAAAQKPAAAPSAEGSQRAVEPAGLVRTDAAPSPVGAYPHARRVGDLLYISGMGPRQPGSGAIPGGPIHDADGAPRDYDTEAQTRAVIANIRVVLAEVGLGLEHVVDVTSFLIDMDRDFATYNEVYAEHFKSIQATRTTVSVRALPTPIAVELKVVAKFPS
jgi:reactive intermediate/imine deaminase